MIPLPVPRWAIYLVICIAIAAGALGYRAHVYHTGVADESARRDAIDAKNNAVAKQARADLNARIAVLQGMLDTARKQVAKLKKDLDDEQAVSTKRQADLAAGHERERVLIRAVTSQASPDGQAPGAAAAGVDSGTSVETDLDPRVAGWLEGVRAEHNAAVERLDACIQSYDAVKAAVDAMP